jgi:SAM-dependent methyltransferase
MTDGMFRRRHERFLVPEEFNRNSPTVASLMPPEESGRWLLERMRRHLGAWSYRRWSLLDFGCGVRFTQAILNERLPIGEYAGVDCYGPMIEFLRTQVKDPRFTYRHLDVRNPMYNPAGEALGPQARLELPARHYDVACMFSVLTHQDPEDARQILALLRRHVRPRGRLFFTCFLDEAIPSFEDRSPERNAGRCFYNPGFLEDLVRASGWQVAGRFAAHAPLIGDSYACRPA